MEVINTETKLKRKIKICWFCQDVQFQYFTSKTYFNICFEIVEEKIWFFSFVASGKISKCVSSPHLLFVTQNMFQICVEAEINGSMPDPI